MEPWLLALLLKPLFAFLFLSSCLLLRYLVIWFVPEGRVKRLLLTPLGKKARRDADIGVARPGR